MSGCGKFNVGTAHPGEDRPETAQRAKRADTREQHAEHCKRQEHEHERHEQKPEHEERQPQRAAAAGLNGHKQRDQFFPSSCAMASAAEISPRFNFSSTSPRAGLGFVSTNSSACATRFSRPFTVG